MFAKNVGTLDKALRIIIGLALIGGAFAGYGLWMWVGVIPLLTGLLGSCLIYTVLGIRTCPAPNK
jgi:CHASE2 domain-containing sensor protein